ncbi:hypothetical protein C8R44DRAFT_736170 [Mycena epipterygia]|nr:hypothetical protein C8R44DRAFT_736170 [Mycena epipterygia]
MPVGDYFPFFHLFSLCKDFRQLAEKRIALMQFRKSAEYISRKACDNMEVYYCCESCQRIDWEHYHRRKYLHALFRTSLHSYAKTPMPRSTLFFYSIGERPRISVQDSSAFPNSSETINFKGLAARAAPSGGRMDMHIIAMQPDGGPTVGMFPMRSSASTLHDEVRRLAAVGEEPTVVSRKLRDLIQSSRELGLVKIH